MSGDNWREDDDSEVVRALAVVSERIEELERRVSMLEDEMGIIIGVYDSDVDDLDIDDDEDEDDEEIGFLGEADEQDEDGEEVAFLGDIDDEEDQQIQVVVDRLGGGK